jgi:hypothetical protein
MFYLSLVRKLLYVHILHNVPNKLRNGLNFPEESDDALKHVLYERCSTARKQVHGIYNFK